jgi:hypothetical protein
MPDRVLKASILGSERIASVSEGAQLLYYKLISLVDDYGLYDARVRVVARQAFLLMDIPEAVIASRLVELDRCGALRLYIVDGKPYLQLQRFNGRIRQQKPRYPLPPETPAAQMELSLFFPSEPPADDSQPLPCSGSGSGSGSYSGSAASASANELPAAAAENPALESPGPRKLPSREQVAWVREALSEYMGGQWGEPDDAICCKIIARMRGHPLADLRQLLVDKLKQNRMPGRSWAWFERVVGDHFAGREIYGDRTTASEIASG